MRHRLLIALIIIGLIAGRGALGTTAYFGDSNQNAGNTFEAWVNNIWTQTTQVDFEAGFLNNVDTSSSPGDVKLVMASNWYDINWQYRRAITFSAATSMANYQVLVTLTTAMMGNPYANVKSDGSDIRFTDPDGTTLQDYWVESWDNTGTSKIWVEVVTSGISSIYIYYGNVAASSASDGKATFDFFDDFEEHAIGEDPDGWTDQGTENFYVALHGSEKWFQVNTCDNWENGSTASGMANFGDAVWSSRIYYHQSGSNSWGGIGVHIGNGNIGRIVVIRDGGWYRANEPDWSGASGWQANADIHFPLGTKGRIELVTNGTNLDAYWYNPSGYSPEKVTIFTGFTIPAGTGKLDVHIERPIVGNTRWVDADDIIVRKYADPELTTSLGTEGTVIYVSSGNIASQVLDTGMAGTTWDSLFWTETSDTFNWYDSSWSYRRAITLSPATSVADYQVLITLTTAVMGNPYSNINADGSDIRFTGADEVTLQDYWIESWDNTGTSYIWVEVSTLGTSTVYMYYGNVAASSASDGTSTFDFFDDFSGDLSKWTIDPENTDQVYIDSLQGNSAPALRHDPDSSQTKNGYFDTRLRTSSYTMKDGVIEYDVFLAGAPRIIHKLGFRVDSLSFTNGYCWRMQNLAADGGWFRFNSGSWSKIGTNWGPTTGDVWHSVKMEIVDTDFTAYVDGGGAIPVTDTNKQTEDYLISHVHGVSLTASSYVLVDNVRVRKYASVEPTASVGTEDSRPAQVVDITFEVRASDTPFLKDDATPSWTAVGGTSPVTSGLPSGQYMQWRATLTTSDTSKTPVLHEVTVEYY